MKLALYGLAVFALSIAAIAFVDFGNQPKTRRDCNHRSMASYEIALAKGC